MKEMVENSIDAHATNIVVTISKGGLKQMQIQDNGDGIQVLIFGYLSKLDITNRKRIYPFFVSDIQQANLGNWTI